MKKKVLALALCLSLLPWGSVLAAGSAEDPFISESYINGTFIPAVESVVKAMLDALEDGQDEAVSPSTGMLTATLSAGKIIKLSAGQTIIVLSGYAEISKDKGYIVNATMGLEAGSGTLYKNHRYIVCEDSSATVRIFRDSTVYMSENARVEDAAQPSPTPGTVLPTPSSAPIPSPSSSPSPTPSASPSPSPEASSSPMPFTDVDPSQRCYNDILSVYEKGLIQGLTPTLFGPGNRLTLAESYKLSACLHHLYNATSLFPGNQEPWYKGYTEYCKRFSIAAQFSGSYNAAITRRQLAELIFSALPENKLSPINSIPDGSISDVPTSQQWAEAVYTLYRAGIFTGYTADSVHSAHDFAPDDYITRAEAMAVINRILDASQRVRFTTE